MTNDVSGIIGRDALSDEFKEVFSLILIANFIIYVILWCWESNELNNLHVQFQDSDIIMLTVGYLPGMKVTAIPLFENNKHMIDKFVTDIREFSTSVSGRDSPAAIIMFGVSLLSCYLCIYMSIILFIFVAFPMLTGVCLQDDYDSAMKGVVEKMG